MFRFIIEYFDEMDNITTFCKGIVKAKNYESAIRKIIDYVGEENFMGIEKLYELDGILEDNDIINNIIK